MNEKNASIGNYWGGAARPAPIAATGLAKILFSKITHHLDPWPACRQFRLGSHSQWQVKSARRLLDPEIRKMLARDMIANEDSSFHSSP